MRWRLLVCSLITVTSAARADVANRNYLPFGERSAMLGNAGFCSPNGEAVFYNPANLARIDYPTLSVSGSTFLLYKLTADPYLVIDGEGQPFSASGFVAIPSSLTSTYKVGGWTLATAILVPEAITFKNRQTYEFTNLKATVLSETLSQSLWLGGGVAHQLAPDWYFGASAFVIQETEARVSIQRIEQMMAVSEASASSDTSVLNVAGVLGLAWQPTRSFNVGLRVATPTVELKGSADIWASQVISSAMTPMGNMSAEQVYNGVHASKPSPTDLGLGFALRPRAGVEVMLDLGLQLPATITTLDDPVLGTKSVKAVLAPRVGIGGELEIAKHKLIRLGALYNRSSNHQPTTSDSPSRDNYLGVTAGFSFQRDRTVTSIGVFGLQTKSELIVQGSDPPRLSDARVRLYGASIALSYRL